MKTTSKTLWIVLVFLSTICFSGSELFAQFKVSAELRFRGEVLHGYKKLLPEKSGQYSFISQRTRLIADYNHKLFSTRISLQDVRMWGGENIASKTGVWGDTVGIDLNEAWVNLKLCKNFNLTVGRQYFKYDDQRLLAWRNWNQYSLSYDAVKLSFMKSSWQIDMGLSWNNKFIKLLGKEAGTNNYYNDGWRIKSLNFLYVKRKFSKSYISFSVIASGVQKTNNTSDVFNFKLTYGPYVKLIFNKVDIMLNAFLQNGHDANSKEVMAYMFSADAGYKISNFRIGAGIDYISGDDASNTSQDYMDKNHSFDLLYGARFKFYGWMNLFGVLPSATKTGGLVDIYPNISYTFFDKHNVKLFYHFFALQNNVLKKGTTNEYYDKNLGSEMDFMYTYNAFKEASLSLGASYYFTNETMDALNLGYDTNGDLIRSESPYWAWIMLTIKPTLFSGK